MKFSEINFDVVKEYLVVDDTEKFEIEIYIASAKSYVKTYANMTDDELDENEYYVAPTLMLISSFYENKTVEMTGKVNVAFKSLLTLGKNHSL